MFAPSRIVTGFENSFRLSCAIDPNDAPGKRFRKAHYDASNCCPLCFPRAIV